MATSISSSLCAGSPAAAPAASPGRLSSTSGAGAAAVRPSSPEPGLFASILRSVGADALVQSMAPPGAFGALPPLAPGDAPKMDKPEGGAVGGASDEQTGADAQVAGDNRTERPRGRREDDLNDPVARNAAQLAPPMQTPPAPLERATTAAVTASARASLEELVPVLVRRIAWSGDARKGTVRLELGAGALSGATLLIEADGRDVRVRLDAPAGTDSAAWRERLRARLAARGLAAEVEVT